MSLIQYLLLFLGYTLFLYLNNYNLIYSHIPNNNNQFTIQEIIDQQDNIKVQFGYKPENIKINTLTDLNFSVLNLKTDEHIKNFLARVVVTEGSELFGFDNITVSDGDFSVKHSFVNYGNHQVFLRVDTNSSIIPASFNVMIPFSQSPSPSSSSSPFLVDSDKSKLDSDKSTPNFITYLIIGIGVLVSVGMVTILLKKLKKK